MTSLQDDIEDLLKLGVGYSPRLKKIKRTLKKNQSLWPADVLYVKQLSEYYLRSKTKKDESTTYEKGSFQIKNPTYDEKYSNDQIKTSDEPKQKKKNNSSKNERIIVIGTILALSLFLTFVIFPIPEQTPPTNGLMPSDSTPIGFSSNTAIQNSSLTEKTNLLSP